MLSTTLLSTNEIVGMGVIEITSIPDISILTNSAQIVTDYKQDMTNLLTSIYQQYKVTSAVGDMSLECLWLTQAVANQPYKANIRLFLIVRAIDTDTAALENTLNSIIRICHTTLDRQKYEYREIGYDDELKAIVAQVSAQTVTAIVKEERVENLQNQILPYCYAFDRLPASNQDLSRIVNTLINYPDCAVSFQLVPLTYSEQETAELGKLTQMLDTLYKGIAEQGVGSVSISLAEKPAATYKYYAQNKNNALYQFSIVVYGDSAAAANLTTSVSGQLNGAAGDTVNFRFVPLSAHDIGKDNNFYPQPWAINEILLSAGKYDVAGNLYRLPHIITAEEASEFFRLPFGNDKIQAGLNVNKSDKTGKTYANNIINAGDIIVGRLKSSARGDNIGFSLDSLAKHMFVVGTPGSGKTEFSTSLLDRLWHEHHIPFLAIEPAKNEYRSLIESIPELQVFTPGKNFISPFVFNPFVPPKNVKLETYKSTLKTAFAAAVSMSSPLDKIFEESINNCYSDFRWLDTYTANDKGKIFNISDFIRCFQKTFDEIGYTGDARNIGRAGVVRLQSLVNLFDNYFSISIEDMLKKPTLIELAAIENADQKALIISLILLSVLAYVNANYVGEGGLKNVILLEEAHVLLDADSNKGQGEANPAQIAQGLVKRMLAEIRSYGVGLVIADQSPRKVGIDVVALTDMKVAFRLVEATDKQILADSTSMTDMQIQRLAKLKPGEAFLFFNKLEEPEEVITPLYREKHGIPISLSDERLKELSHYWKHEEKQKNLRPYPECKHVSCCLKTCDYNRRVLSREIARRLFNRYFKFDTKDFEPIKELFSQISNLIKTELNDEPFNAELLTCVKVQLWRRIKYGTKIPITEELIYKSLIK
ncbi:MAG: ATP-binding protein [Lentimicrobiaceae bacterium]|jgi:DNA helicase HerA-like ATPase|nr:ATP-binding protein [Lentimicrobiaceae bacterium]